jgi:argininosuccinate lyase
MTSSATNPAVPAYIQSGATPYLASLPVDRALARFDVAGSVAHARMLAHTGILSEVEAATLVRGLERVATEVATGVFPWRPELEDVHTNVERRLTELVGPVGGKIHTGRSRNDQVALDERLYLRSACFEVGSRVHALQQALWERAGQEVDTLLPGYTHLQRAQPVSLAHHLLAHFWRLERDLDRLLATERRANVSPLGAGALAGSTLPIDPAQTAYELGFEGPFQNSLDAVSDRDGFAELLFDLALLSVHLSALGEELVLWTSAEFGFARAGPRLGSGSSLMPQKRNADVAELARAKAGRAIGSLTGLLAMLKGLPLAYDRDLQEDKPPVLDSVQTVSATLDALTPALQEIAFDRARMRQAASDPALRATDLAEELVRQGVPFRTAHEEVARLVRDAGGTIDAGNVRATFPQMGASVEILLDPAHALEGRTTPGGPSPAMVRVQLEQAHRQLAAQGQSLSSLGRRVELIEELLKEKR